MVGLQATLQSLQQSIRCTSIFACQQRCLDTDCVVYMVLGQKQCKQVPGFEPGTSAQPSPGCNTADLDDDATQHRSKPSKNFGTVLDYACHPCAGAMLIFSVSFQFYQMPEGTITGSHVAYIPEVFVSPTVQAVIFMRPTNISHQHG